MRESLPWCARRLLRRALKAYRRFQQAKTSDQYAVVNRMLEDARAELLYLNLQLRSVRVRRTVLVLAHVEARAYWFHAECLMRERTDGRFGTRMEKVWIRR